MAGTQENLSASERLIEFIQKNRRALFAGFLVIALGLIGTVIGLTVQDRVRVNAFIRLDEFTQRHIELMPYADAVYRRRGCFPPG